MTQVTDFSVMAQDGQPFALEAYRGQVLLIVNTATGCGFTPQYQGLQALYDRYRDQADPLYTWLKSQKRGRMGRRIEWNFAKFLINRQGQVVKRYFATTKPERIARDIERLLGEK